MDMDGDSLVRVHEIPSQVIEQEIIPLLIETNEAIGRWLNLFASKRVPKEAKDVKPSETFRDRYNGHCPDCDAFIGIKAEAYGDNNVYCSKCGQLVHFNIEGD